MEEEEDESPIRAFIYHEDSFFSGSCLFLNFTKSILRLASPDASGGPSRKAGESGLTFPVVIWVDVLFEARVRPDAWRVRNSTFLQNPGLKPSGLAIICILQRLRMGPIHKFMYGRRRRGLVIIIFMIMRLPRRCGKAPQCIRKQAIPYYKTELFFRILAWSLRTL